MLNALESFEKASCEAGVVTTIYAATLEARREAFEIMKKYSAEQFPVNLMFPFEAAGDWTTGRRKAVIALSGYILTPLKSKTITYRTRQIEDEFVYPMKVINMKFSKEINGSAIKDATRPLTDRIRPAYQVENPQWFGTFYTITVPILETVC
jgi:hypothetical protein